VPQVSFKHDSVVLESVIGNDWGLILLRASHYFFSFFFFGGEECVAAAEINSQLS